MTIPETWAADSIKQKQLSSDSEIAQIYNTPWQILIQSFI